MKLLFQTASPLGLRTEMNGLVDIMLDGLEAQENRLKDAKTAISHNQRKLRSASTASLINGITQATTFCIAKAKNGERFSEGEAISMVGGIVATMVGMVNPIAGAAFALTFSVIGGVLPGPKRDDPFNQLYERIMGEVRELVTEKVNQAQFLEFQTEAAMLLDELEFVASLLNSTQAAASKFEDQLNLMWLLMFQHDLRVIRYQLSGSSVCSNGNHFTQECRDWHKNCVFTLVDQVLHAERGVAEKLLKLEPEWGVKVDDRIVGEVPDTRSSKMPTF